MGAGECQRALVAGLAGRHGDDVAWRLAAPRHRCRHLAQPLITPAWPGHQAAQGLPSLRRGSPYQPKARPLRRGGHRPVGGAGSGGERWGRHIGRHRPAAQSSPCCGGVLRTEPRWRCGWPTCRAQACRRQLAQGPVAWARDERDVAPRRRQVATRIGLSSLMRLRLARSRHRIVAADTVSRRALEASVDMARGAGDGGGVPVIGNPVKND